MKKAVRSERDVLVIGCGVSGLSCGIRLLERGFQAKILARDLPPHTTSNVAAAIWYPYKAFPAERVLAWSTHSFQVFLQLMADLLTGVSMTTLVEPFTERVADPWWSTAVPNFRHAIQNELPSGFVDGYVADVPLIETPVYMRYLVDRFLAAGGVIEQREIRELTAVTTTSPLIINCAGLGARELVADETLYPIRGQIVRVAAVPGLRAFIDDHSHFNLAYIIPRRDGVVLGGTAKEGDWNLEVDAETAVSIHQKCLQLEPRLKDALILEHLVGLRPGRAQVRLEVEHLAADCTVIHNYGHGGAGFTLSWGCAEEVVSLALSVIGNP